MKWLALLASTALVCLFICSHAGAAEVMKKITKDDLKIELHVMKAEPFYTKEDVAAKNIKSGMLIMGGAKPLGLEDTPRPTHHLIIHVFDAKSGKAITNADVSMSFQSLNAKGKPSGSMVDVPVVIMEAVGRGPQSTHYGNNVSMADGPYRVFLTVNGKKVDFKITVRNAPGKMKM